MADATLRDHPRPRGIRREGRQEETKTVPRPLRRHYPELVKATLLELHSANHELSTPPPLIKTQSRSCRNRRNQAEYLSQIMTELSKPSPQENFRVVEVDDEGWAAFKALKAQHRREYAVSSEAIADHQAWVSAPMPLESSWGSIPSRVREITIIPSPSHIPWENRYDWALEKLKP